MSENRNEIFTISLKGKIEFEPEHRTRKQSLQSSWKKVAMIVFKDDTEAYYRWFFNNRFNINLLSTVRGAHVTFISDSLGRIGNESDSLEMKEEKWNSLKKKWDGKEIEVTLNLRPFYDLNSDWEKDIPVILTEEEIADGKIQKVSHTYHWWLIGDHKFRDESHSIRAEIGLPKPFLGLHMTFGVLTQNYKFDKNNKLALDSKGQPIPIFNPDIEHAKQLHKLYEKDLILINQDYGKDYKKESV